jgi:hypothetical protein
MKRHRTLSSAFESYAPVPSPAVWDRVLQRLPEPRRKRRGFWWMTAAACLALLAAGSWYFDFDVSVRPRQHGPSPVAAVPPVTSLPPASPAGSLLPDAGFASPDPAGAVSRRTARPSSVAHGGTSVSAFRRQHQDYLPPDNPVFASRMPESIGLLQPLAADLEVNPRLLPDPGNPPREIFERSAKPSSRWTMATGLMAESSFRTLSAGHGAAASPTSGALAELDLHETALHQPSGYASAGYLLSPRWTLTAGLAYFSQGQQRAVSDIVLSSGNPGSAPTVYSIITSAGTISGSGQQFDEAFFQNADSSIFQVTSTVAIPDAQRAFTLQQQFDFISVPILLQFRPRARHWTPYLGLGFSTAFLMRQRIRVNGQEVDYDYAEQLRKVMFFAEAQAGIEWTPGRQLSLQLQPTFRYGLRSFTVDDGVRWMPYSIGIGGGIAYRF